MPKKNMKSALSASLDAEKQALKSRFETADAYFSDRDKEESPQSQPHSKVIRDAFTFPEEDYQLISKLRDRLLSNAVNASKSEVLRAGLIALDRMGDRKLVELIGSLTKIKTGRPKKK